MQKSNVFKTTLYMAIAGVAGLFGCESDDGPGPEKPNVAPSSPIVSIAPGVPTTADELIVSIDEESQDSDGDAVSYKYKWFLDGVAQDQYTEASIPSSETQKGQRWEVKVRASDGKDDSSPATAVTSIVNSVPSISVTLEPVNPTSSEDLTAVVIESDADGDDITLMYSWRVDTGVSTRTGAVVPSGDTSLDQVWTVTVIANDGESQSPPAMAMVKIGNAVPVIDGVEIQPAVATSADQLFASTGMVSDRDGDAVTLSFDWLADGVSIQSGADRILPPGSASRGQSVTVAVTPNDGFSDGITVTSTAVVLGNAPPQLAQVLISPNGGNITTTFSCDSSAAIDYDQDTLTYDYKWYVNDTETTQTSSLAAPLFSRGDRIYCEVAVSDGIASTGLIRSPTITVGNAPPSLGSVTIGPNMPTEADTLTASIMGYSDPEGDSEGYQYSWRVNSRQVATSTTINGAVFNRGDIIVLSVVPYDGLNGGVAVLSNALTIQNSIPTIDSVTLSPDPAGTGDDLIATAVGYTDLDPGDSRQFAFEWTVDGVVLPLTIGVLSSSSFARGSTVSAAVTPSDGITPGVPVSSLPLVIANTLPLAPAIHIEPAVPDESMDLTCVIDSPAYDADNDNLTYSYSWLVDGMPSTETSSIVLATETTDEEVWTCQVQANDGYGAGATGTSDAYVVARCDAIELDGGSDYVSVGLTGNEDYGNSTTVEAWIKWDGNLTTGFDQAVYTHRPEVDSISIGVFGRDMQSCACPGKAPGLAYFRWGDSCGTDTCVTAPNGLQPNTWIHLAGVYNGGTAVLYLDGVAVATTTSAAAIESIVGTSSVGIGAQSDGSDSFFGGQISEIRVSTAAVYLSDFTPDTRLSSDGPTTAHYKFDEATGSVLNDSSGHSNAGVLHSGNWVVSGPACLYDFVGIATRYAVAQCQFRSRCELVLYPYLSSDEASCVATRTTNLITLYSSFLPMLVENRLSYEESIFDSCLAALDTASCSRGVDTNTCEFLVGQRTLGQPCSVSDECVEGTYCPVGGQFGSCAACTLRAADGQDCSNTACREGSDCLTVGTSQLCISFRGDVGGQCGTVVSGLCRGRLQCVGSTIRTCREPSGLSSTCDPQQTMGPTCNIYLNHVCDNGRCVTGNWVGVGGSCAGSNQCDVNGTCNSSTQVCDALPSAGQPCLSGRCAPDHYCDNGTCRADIVTGAACTATSQCQPNKYCINGTCQDYSWTECN